MNYKIQPSYLVPPGYMIVSEDSCIIFVHPDSMEYFMNLMRKEFKDAAGHKAFAE